MTPERRLEAYKNLRASIKAIDLIIEATFEMKRIYAQAEGRKEKTLEEMYEESLRAVQRLAQAMEKYVGDRE